MKNFLITFGNARSFTQRFNRTSLCVKCCGRIELGDKCGVIEGKMGVYCFGCLQLYGVLPRLEEVEEGTDANS